MKKEERYSILKTGNFYLPILYKGKKFEVLDTYTIHLEDKKLIKIFNLNNELRDKIFIKTYADIFWKAIKKEKLDQQYKNYWIIPISLSKENDSFMVTLDILKPIK